MTAENSTNIKDLSALIRRYFPSNPSYDDPAYQSSVEHQWLVKRQKEMLENEIYRTLYK